MTDQQRPHRTAWSLAEVAEQLGLTYEQVRRLCHSGELHSIRAGRYIRVPVAALDEFLRGRTPVLDRAEYIRQVVDQAPRLTAEQADRLAALLRPAPRSSGRQA